MNANDIFAATDIGQDMRNAKQGDFLSAIRTGYKFAAGLAGRRYLGAARYYFILGAQGNADASPWIHYLNIKAAMLSNVPLADGTLEKLIALADQGDVVAETLLGRVQEQGWQGAKSDIAAAETAYISVGSQFVLAKTFLGELYLRQNHIDEAEDLFQTASESNETRAIVNLALIRVRKQRVVEAKELLKSAVSQNSCRAMYRLGMLYQKGVGGAKPQPTLALLLFQRAARMGYPLALKLLQGGNALSVGG